MYYFLGKSINKNMSVYHILNKVFGIGLFQIRNCCKHLGLKEFSIWANLTNKGRILISDYIITKIFKEEKLKEFRMNKIIKLKQIKCYRGNRLSLGLPVRGQRTQTNKKTSKKIKQNENIRIF